MNLQSSKLSITSKGLFSVLLCISTSMTGRLVTYFPGFQGHVETWSCSWMFRSLFFFIISFHISSGMRVRTFEQISWKWHGSWKCNDSLARCRLKIHLSWSIFKSVAGLLLLRLWETHLCQFPTSFITSSLTNMITSSFPSTHEGRDGSSPEQFSLLFSP